MSSTKTHRLRIRERLGAWMRRIIIIIILDSLFEK